MIIYYKNRILYFYKYQKNVFEYKYRNTQTIHKTNNLNLNETGAMKKYIHGVFRSSQKHEKLSRNLCYLQNTP